MLTHHHHEHLLRQREERGIETAEDGGGGLDEVDHLVDEPAGFAGGGGNDAADVGGERLRGGPDRLAPLVEADFDGITLEELGVVRGARYLRDGGGTVAEQTGGAPGGTPTSTKGTWWSPCMAEANARGG